MKNVLNNFKFIPKSITEFIKYRRNLLILRRRFKNSIISKPLEITSTNLNNIYISDEVIIGSNAILRILNNCKLFIGEGTHIGPYCHISGTENKIIIKRDVLISDRVFISTTHHRYYDIKKPINRQGFISKGDVIIGDECLIGIGSCILSGVNIGKHSIIGANSVVTKNIPPYSVAVGNPAKVIKQYIFSEKKWVKKG